LTPTFKEENLGIFPKNPKIYGENPLKRALFQEINMTQPPKKSDEMKPPKEMAKKAF